MNRYWFVLLLSCISLFTWGQQQQLLFQKTYGDTTNAAFYYADELNGGDYILIGKGPSAIYPLTGYDVVVMFRCNAAGDTLWRKEYGDPFNGIGISAIVKTRKGTYLVAGTTFAGVTYDAALWHLDAQGNQLFYRVFTAGTGLLDFGGTVCETRDSAILFQCNLNLLSQNNVSPTCIKLDWQGNEIWRKRNDGIANHTTYSFRSMPDSGFIANGMASYSMYDNAFIARYRDNGELLWIRYPFGISDTISNASVGLFVHAGGTFSAAFLQSDANGFNRKTHIKHYDGQGNQTGETAFDFPAVFSFYALTNYPARGTKEATVLAIEPPYSRSGFRYYEIDTTNWNARELIRFTDADSLNTYTTYAIPTRDGGLLAVGSKTDQYYGRSRFCITKFASDGRYTAEPFWNTINLYPNPAADGNVIVSFDVKYTTSVLLRVRTPEGKIIAETPPLVCPEASYNRMPLKFGNGTPAAGIYIIEIRSEQQVFYRKLVITDR